MWNRVYVVVVALTLALAPWTGLAQHKDSGAAGRAREHRSESAKKNSNAQWSDDATRGQERAEERRNPAAGEKTHPDHPRGKDHEPGKHDEDENHDPGKPKDRGADEHPGDKGKPDKSEKPKKAKN